AELWNGETAVANSSGETVLTGTGIHGFQYGVAVGEGSVLFRGSFDHITSKAVASCNWDLLSTIPCAVDASYSYWGSDQGPEALTCGVVITSPWLKGGGQQISDGSAWSGGNCDDSATAAAQLAEKEKTFREQFDALGIQCGGNPSIQEACDKQAQLFGCMDAGVAVLKNHLGDSFDWLPGFVAGKFVEKIIDGSGSMIKGMVKNDISRIEDNKAVFDSLAASTKLYFELNDTYNTCIAP
ncbi:MAG TPA: hypothetical protein VFM05_14985, partial [Candidatus Saccharimonadales bacterium]|nr:hypothetical protein [Candidatus Saccharimonadales bacterium]